ncbi:uncharacterized protein H6S33_003299 [Morchella sextelata]|uniref:uncharacterized protein n=1 Tax=Morchella sextelata TaxID=1174677 RepID=UPI001D051EE9|nr:uncharacterized protein H6S33_003299 [Morchella sextelata]KAH0607311.1 hypothetical protein H6S33_003299 [Morchella sextelata]
MTNPSQKFYYLAGQGVRHSIAPTVHQTVADALGLPWTYRLLDIPSVKELMSVFRQPDFAAGVVTMPYKKTIMPHLDRLDELCTTLGSCNNVYIDGDGKLVGSNTDWIGILECLRTASEKGVGKPAMVIGAGGASRAAVYALFAHLKCTTIYVINRDDQEVADLQSDARAYGEAGPTIVHVKSLSQIESIAAEELPAYVVGTVPDFEPQTESEIEASKIVKYVFEKTPEEGRGVFLDMCFNPRKTRLLKAAGEQGWRTVEGINIIGWQLERQYTLWAGAEAAKNIPYEKAWEALRKAADASTIINK